MESLNNPHGASLDNRLLSGNNYRVLIPRKKEHPSRTRIAPEWFFLLHLRRNSGVLYRHLVYPINGLGRLVPEASRASGSRPLPAKSPLINQARPLIGARDRFGMLSSTTSCGQYTSESCFGLFPSTHRLGNTCLIIASSLSTRKWCAKAERRYRLSPTRSIATNPSEVMARSNHT